MKHFVLPVVSLLLLSNLTGAQSRRSIRVKAGDDIAQAYSPNGFYRFPKFSKATLFYKGGAQNPGQSLNYNILSGAMQLLDPKGKIFNLVNPSKIDSVVFEKNVFVYSDGFMENVIQSGPVTLLKKIIIKTRAEKIGALGLPNQSVSIDNIIYSANTDVYNFIINSDVVVIENVYWYWMDRDNNILKATKGNFLKLLPPEKKSSAETYIKQQKINFENEDDLKELVANPDGNN